MLTIIDFSTFLAKATALLGYNKHEPHTRLQSRHSQSVRAKNLHKGLRAIKPMHSLASGRGAVSKRSGNERHSDCAELFSRPPPLCCLV